LLVELVGPATEIAVDEAGILSLGLTGAAHRPSQHRIGETRGEPFQLSLDQAGNILVRAGVARRDVCVAVEGVLTRWRARRVKQGVLADDYGGALRHVSPLAGLRSSGQIA
jgi:hypothetical protein